MTDDATALGIKILAITDAAFRPVRDVLTPHWSESWQTRWGFEKHGVKYCPGGTGPADWQKSARSKAILRRNGLLLEFRSGAARTYRVRLTEAGDRYFRQLVGLSEFSTEFLQDIQRLRHHPDTTRDGWIPEETIAEAWGFKVDNSVRVLIEDMHYPAAVRGLIESNCDTRRHVFYRFTDRGNEWLESPPAESESIVQELPGAWDLYHTERRTALDNLGVVKPGEDRELGAMPLPASVPRLGTQLATVTRKSDGLNQKPNRDVARNGGTKCQAGNRHAS